MLISDISLKQAIQRTLCIFNDDITIEDMDKLTHLSSAYSGIKNIDGLKYAKNLEVLNLDFNEITDISSLKELDNLKFISIKNQLITNEAINILDGKIEIVDNILDKNGNKLYPKNLLVSQCGLVKILDIEDLKLEDKILLDVASLNPGVVKLTLKYEDNNNDFSLKSLYMRKV